MKGDIVQIHGTTDDANIAVYEPIMDPNRAGYFMVDAKNNVLVRAIGGVKPGSRGKIDGEGIRVAMASISKAPSLGLGNDSTMLYPVIFEQYQRVGWISSDSFRIVQGDTL